MVVSQGDAAPAPNPPPMTEPLRNDGMRRRAVIVGLEWAALTVLIL
ncbi:MAG: hypothetical protein QOI86_4728, partial [Actinomycetota bacterium]|nr:hypothetical protein [Actinomycetota bacterium]